VTGPGNAVDPGPLARPEIAYDPIAKTKTGPPPCTAQNPPLTARIKIPGPTATARESACYAVALGIDCTLVANNLAHTGTFGVNPLDHKLRRQP